MFSLLIRITILGVFLKLAHLIAKDFSSQDTNILSNALSSGTLCFQYTPLNIERKLSSLLSERKWKQIVEVTNKALNYNKQYEGSFKFWYCKALAECSLWEIQSCEKSYLTASLFAGDKYQSSITKMKKMLDLILKTKQKALGTQNKQDALLI